MKKTLLVAAILVVATVLAAGLAVLPNSAQEAQANPCSVNSETDGGEASGTAVTGGSASATATSTGSQECDLNGNIEFDED